MQRELSRFIGRRVEIIYLSKNCRISQRQIKILSVDGEYVHAYCLTKRAPRVFRSDCVLAVMPILPGGGMRNFA